MRILFVLENYYPFIGGAEVLFKNLCEGLAGRGHKVTVLTSLLQGTIPQENINGVSVRRIRLPSRGRRYWFSFVAIPQAIKLAGKADFVHTTTYNGAFPAWLAAKLRRRPAIITVLEILGPLWAKLEGMNLLSSFLHRLLERLIISLPFDHDVAISRYTSGCLRRYGVKDNRISVIYPGIDYHLFNPVTAKGKRVREQLYMADDLFVYMYFGRPGVSKGIVYLVKAVPLISTGIANSKLLLILSREPTEGYQRIISLIKDLDIEDKVILIDPVQRDALPDYVAASDCVVVPSLSEGFGFTAAEACAMGRPVVASDIASLPEVVSGKYLLIKPQDHVAIADGISAIYNNRYTSSATKMFFWERSINDYITLCYGDLIQ
jgi:glycosyltransferase involved in cell wall biosynthesis